MHVKCPNCGESYYAVKYSTRTAMYFPAIYKDGINQNPDGNITTTQCECINCHYMFSYRERYGKVLDVTLGEKVNPDWAINDFSNSSITVPTTETITITQEDSRNAEIERLKREIESLKDRLAEVQANPQWHMEMRL